MFKFLFDQNNFSLRVYFFLLKRQNKLFHEKAFNEITYKVEYIRYKE